MKILKAQVDFEECVIEYPEMDITDFIHKLVGYSRPQKEAEITQERIDQFTRNAAKAFVSSKSAWNTEEFTKLYVEKEIEKFKLIERQLQSQHEIVTAYSLEIKFLQKTIASLMKNK